ncbi:hypothetical protein D3C73_1268440 [compost metagenome]
MALERQHQVLRRQRCRLHGPESHLFQAIGRAHDGAPEAHQPDHLSFEQTAPTQPALVVLEWGAVLVEMLNRLGHSGFWPKPEYIGTCLFPGVRMCEHGNDQRCFRSALAQTHRLQLLQEIGIAYDMKRPRLQIT